MQNTSTLTLPVILSLAISVLALTVSSLSLYFQRKDKRPRLIVALERGFMEIPKNDGDKEKTYRPFPDLNIHVRNPTERIVKIVSVHFTDSEKRNWVLPKKWVALDEVPSHDRRTLRISLVEFEKWARGVNIAKPEKGKFVVTDALSNQYETPVLGNISLEPITKP